MRKSLVYSIAVLAIVVLVVSGFLVFSQPRSTPKKSPSGFYVGVSYCGNTTEGAKLLIDRVKGYTNLFVLSNTPMSIDEAALNAVCNYAISSGLSIVINLGTASEIDFMSYSFVPYWSWQYEWLDSAKTRWGDKFLGLYYYDEPGGTHEDGVWNVNASVSDILNYDSVASFFEWVYKNDSGLAALKARNIPAFTSDYALYWFDYLAGYNVILTELGWNQSMAQSIALVRGAATAQHKDWGTIITWKYNGTPYLDSGDAIYNQLLTAYECGAKYEVIFDYPTYPEGNPYGVLTDEHFEALQRFWHDINAMSAEAYGTRNAQTVLVLPRNYGWGMRNLEDTIWGAWRPDNRSLQIWNISRALLAEYNYRLDIAYDDSAFPVTGLYPEIHYWNESYTGGVANPIG